MARTDSYGQDLTRRVEMTYLELLSAVNKHDEALRLAYEAGIPNTVLAVACGISETAVRNKIKRRGWSR